MRYAAARRSASSARRGAGKTTIALAIMSLLPKPTGKVIQGGITFDGRDLQTLSPKEIRAIRGRDISMIFQDPMSSLNPVLPVDEQKHAI